MVMPDTSAPPTKARAAIVPNRRAMSSGSPSRLRQVDHIDTFGASSLSTLVQMVANGLGMTLLPELSLDLESRHGGIRLMRFADPEPSRTVGLAWRSSSPRKRDFLALGRLIAATAKRRRAIKLR